MMNVALLLDVTRPSPPQKAMSTAYSWQSGTQLLWRQHISRRQSASLPLELRGERGPSAKQGSHATLPNARSVLHLDAGAGAGACGTGRERVTYTSFTAPLCGLPATSSAGAGARTGTGAGARTGVGAGPSIGAGAGAEIGARTGAGAGAKTGCGAGAVTGAGTDAGAGAGTGAM